MALIEFQNNQAPYINANNLNHNFNELKSYILYNNISGSNENIVLSDNAENYSYLEIFFVDNNKHDYSSIKYVPNGENISLSLANGFTDSNVLHFVNRFSIYNVSGKNITISSGRNGFINMTQSNTVVTAGSYIYITRVIGYK